MVAEQKPRKNASDYVSSALYNLEASLFIGEDVGSQLVEFMKTHFVNQPYFLLSSSTTNSSDPESRLETLMFTDTKRKKYGTRVFFRNSTVSFDISTFDEFRGTWSQHEGTKDLYSEMFYYENLLLDVNPFEQKLNTLLVKTVDLAFGEG